METQKFHVKPKEILEKIEGISSNGRGKYQLE